MVFHLCTIKPAISLWCVEPFHLMTWRTGGLHAGLFLTKETHLLVGVNYSGGVILDRKIMTPVMSNRVKPRTWCSCWLCETAREWPFIVTHCVVTCQNAFNVGKHQSHLFPFWFCCLDFDNTDGCWNSSWFETVATHNDLTISGDISIGSRINPSKHIGTQVPTVHTVHVTVCVVILYSDFFKVYLCSTTSFLNSSSSLNVP